MRCSLREPGAARRSLRSVVVDVPLPPRAAPWPEDHRPTAFQQLVVDAVAALAPGELATYGDIALEIERPGSGQAVANVLRSAPDLPWWRVLPATGRLYCSHLPTQGPLLLAEGHVIDGHRRVHAAPMLEKNPTRRS